MTQPQPRPQHQQPGSGPVQPRPVGSGSEPAPEPEYLDVLIVGAGTAGLCAGLWLARAGVDDFAVLERRAGPLERGQADGVQCRTVEVFESFGLAEPLLREACHVLEVAFWSPASATTGTGNTTTTTTTTTESSSCLSSKPDGGGGAGAVAGGGEEEEKEEKRGVRGIERTHCTADTEAGLSHLPHVILNQARVNGLMAEEMGRASSSGRDHVEYGWEVRSVEVDEAPGAAADPDAHCVAVTARSSGEDGGVVKRHFRAKYVLGCDGAHSLVRKALGIEMVGDSTDAVWGVMDVYPRTDFPDIRKKVVINSEAGNLLIIPREGGSMVRFYTELQGAVARDVTLAALQEKARLVFRPYTVDFAETAWWSAYAIGQRLASAFDRAGRVFLAGDACHTHSPKAGQGMNVSLMDGYNLGWKLAAVLQQGRGPAIVADPAALLATYVAERRRTAAELIDFDRYWTRLFNSAFRRANDITPERFRDAFVRAGRYTAGQAIRYENSVLTAAAPGDAALAAGVTVGMRFPSAQVVRLCDARTLQLATALPADARWHIVVFGGDVLESSELRRLHEMSTVLVNIIREFTPPDFEPDSVINPILVLSSKRLGIQQALIPELFTPVTGKWKTKDLFKVFVDDEGYNRSGHGHAYEAYGIDPHQGALVVVRPDQHVAKICSLADVDEVCGFFGGFLRKSSRGDSNNP